MASYFINYVRNTRSNTDDFLAATFLSGAQAAFAIGRFGGAALMYFIRPRWVFLVFMTMCTIFIGPSIAQRENPGAC